MRSAVSVSIRLRASDGPLTEAQVIGASISNEDRIPHDRAVWRLPPAPDCEEFRQVTVDYGNDAIEQTTVALAKWLFVKRWRFGWAPA